MVTIRCWGISCTKDIKVIIEITNQKSLIIYLLKITGGEKAQNEMEKIRRTWLELRQKTTLVGIKAEGPKMTEFDN
jgi:hypothetical protein